MPRIRNVRLTAQRLQPRWRREVSAARAGEQRHPDPHQQREAGRGRVGDQPDQKGERVVVDGKAAAPILAGGVPLRDIEAGVVQRHQRDQQAAQGVQRKEARALAPRTLGRRHGLVLRSLVHWLLLFRLDWLHIHGYHPF